MVTTTEHTSSNAPAGTSSIAAAEVVRCPACDSDTTVRAGMGRGRRCVDCKHGWVGAEIPPRPEPVVPVKAVRKRTVKPKAAPAAAAPVAVAPAVEEDAADDAPADSVASDQGATPSEG